MKKTILAVAVTGMLATTAHAANVYDVDGTTADVYGRVQFDVKDKGGDADITGVGTARFGIEASSAVTSNMKALARGEWQLDAENSNLSNDIAARHVYLGVDHDIAGRLVFGQTDTAFYQAVAATDIFNTYGYAAFAGVEDGRQEGQFVYDNTFGGFYVGASYQFSNEDFEISMGNPAGSIPQPTGQSLDSGYALTLGYQFGFGLDIYGGYHAENLESTAGDLDGTKTNLALSAAYTLNDLYLGLALVQAEYDGDQLGTLGDGTKLTGMDFVAAYTIMDNTSLYGGYAVLDGEEGNVDVDVADEITLGAVYKLNSNAKVWAEYKLDNIDDADDQWTIAAQYNF